MRTLKESGFEDRRCWSVKNPRDFLICMISSLRIDQTGIKVGKCCPKREKREKVEERAVFWSTRIRSIVLMKEPAGILHVPEASLYGTQVKPGHNTGVQPLKNVIWPKFDRFGLFKLYQASFSPDCQPGHGSEPLSQRAWKARKVQLRLNRLSDNVEQETVRVLVFGGL